MRLSALWVALLFAAPLYAADVYNANDGQAHDYPKKQVNDPKGTGKVHTFHDGKPKGPEGTGAKEGDRAKGYPPKSVSEPKGNGRWIDFNQGGTLPYPRRDSNPADNVPMVKPGVHAVVWVEPPVPPDDICPLGGARPIYQEYNRAWREKHLDGLLTNGGAYTLWARDRELANPVRVRGSIRLDHIAWNEQLAQWSATLLIPVGFQCEAGSYDVIQDDGLGKQISVVSVGPEMVLLRIGSKLAYLTTSDTRPRWRLVWDSGIEVNYRQAPSAPRTKKDKSSEGGPEKAPDSDDRQDDRDNNGGANPPNPMAPMPPDVPPVLAPPPAETPSTPPVPAAPEAPPTPPAPPPA